MLDIKESVFSLQTLDDDTIAVIDQASTFRIIDPKSLKIQSGFKSKLYQKQKVFNRVAVSSAGNFSVLSIPDKPKAALYETQTKKLIDRIGEHTGEVEAVAFSDNEQYVATGGTDGKTFIYYATSGTLLFTLAPHRDYVSSIAFSPNTHYVATGSFDQTIIVKNIASMSDSFRLVGHKSVIVKMLFISNNELLSADKEGNLIIWGVKSKGIIKRLPKMADEITDIAITKDEKFLFVSTKNGHIGFYDLDKGELLSAKYLQSDCAINALAITKQDLCYGNDKGIIETFSLLDDQVKLEATYKEKNYLKGYTLVQMNPILEYTDIYKAMEADWDKTLIEAREALIHGRKSEAEWILQPFVKVHLKQTLIKHLFEDFVDFGKFKLYIDEKKYSLAYGLTTKYPSYKETQEYRDLEHIWEKAFDKAKALILENSGEEKARNFLVNFRSIPSKSQMINELFSQKKVYSLFRKKLADRDFETIFALSHKYPFLVSYKEYKDMLGWGDKLFIKMQQLLDSSDYIEASKYAKLLKDFPDFKNDTKSLSEETEIYIQYNEALKSKNIEVIYGMLERYPFLAELAATIEFEQEWDSVEKVALNYASDGNVEKVLKVFKNFINIPYKKVLIATILKSALSCKIKELFDLELSNDELKGILEIFVNFFGKDENVRKLVDNYSKEKDLDFNCEDFGQGSLDTIEFDHFIKKYEQWKS